MLVQHFSIFQCFTNDKWQMRLIAFNSWGLVSERILILSCVLYDWVELRSNSILCSLLIDQTIFSFCPLHWLIGHSCVLTLSYVVLWLARLQWKPWSPRRGWATLAVTATLITARTTAMIPPTRRWRQRSRNSMRNRRVRTAPNWNSEHYLQYFVTTLVGSLPSSKRFLNISARDQNEKCTQAH